MTWLTTLYRSKEQRKTKMAEHKIVLKIEEVETGETDCKGTSVGCKYVGENKDGITPTLAMSGIGAILSTVCDDEDFVKQIVDMVGKKTLKNYSSCERGNSFEEVMEKRSKKNAISDALDSFMRLANDERWVKFITGKECGRMSGANKDTRRHIAAFIAVVCKTLHDATGDDKEGDALTTLFFDQCLGLNSDED